MELIFEPPLQQVKLIKRYKRFLADVEFNDKTVKTIYCPNTGSMKTCGEPGDFIYLSYNPSKSRKYNYTWELTKCSEGYIGINTGLPNKIVKEAIEEGRIPEFSSFSKLTTEPKACEGSRFDILLENNDASKTWIEIKNTTLIHQGSVMFPDAKSTRAQKHMRILAKKS